MLVPPASTRAPTPFVATGWSPPGPGPVAVPTSDDTNAVCSKLTGSFSCLTLAGFTSTSSGSSGGAFEDATVPVTVISFSTACTCDWRGGRFGSRRFFRRWSFGDTSGKRRTGAGASVRVPARGGPLKRTSFSIFV